MTVDVILILLSSVVFGLSGYNYHRSVKNLESSAVELGRAKELCDMQKKFLDKMQTELRTELGRRSGRPERPEGN